MGKAHPVHTVYDTLHLSLGPCEVGRADHSRPGSWASAVRRPQPEAGSGRQAPNEDTKELGGSNARCVQSRQRHTLKSSRRLLSSKSQVHKRDPVTTIIKPQDDASAMSHPHPRGRCQLLKPCPMGSSGGGQEGLSSPQGACLGGAAGEAPHQGTDTSRSAARWPSPSRMSAQGREKIVFLPDQDVTYPKFVDIVRTFSEGGGSHRDVPVGNPWPQESHLRPGRDCQASSLLWSPGQNWDKAWWRPGTPLREQ